MDRQRVYRGLRVGVSVCFGLLCVLLIALWIESYYSERSLSLPGNSRIIDLYSKSGRVEFWRLKMPAGNPRTATKAARFMQQMRRQQIEFGPYSRGSESSFKFYWNKDQYTFVLVVPTWFLVLLAAVLAALPWVRWRFSLRTLLIAMTLIALLFALIVSFSG